MWLSLSMLNLILIPLRSGHSQFETGEIIFKMFVMYYSYHHIYIYIYIICSTFNNETLIRILK